MNNKKQPTNQSENTLTEIFKYEVKEGEYYHEQEEQSAPSWLYIIDGCNVVE